MIKSFLIITKEGTPVFSHSTEESGGNNALISCFLSAIQSFAQEIGDSAIDKIQMQANTFYYASKGPIFSIVIADAKDEIENKVYKITAERISRSFLEKFGESEICERCSEVSFFKSFQEEYEGIVKEVGKVMELSQKDFVTEYFVRAASDSNIIGMIVFDLEKDEIIASDIPSHISMRSFESFSSMLFNFVDRLGHELKSGSINEILMRAEEYWIGGFRKGNLAVFMLFNQEYFGNILPDFVKSAVE